MFISHKGFLARGGPAAVNIKATGLFFLIDQKEEILTVIHYIRKRARRRRGGRAGGGGRAKRGIKKRVIVNSRGNYLLELPLSN